MLSAREVRVRLLWMRTLRPGWDQFTARPVSALAIANVDCFLSECRSGYLDPDQFSPDHGGGIIVSFSKLDRAVDLYFGSNGKVKGLFLVTSNPDDVPHQVDIVTSVEGYRFFLYSVSEYLGIKLVQGSCEGDDS